MNTFSIVRDALAKTENDPSKVGLDAATVEAGRVIAAVQTVVDALTPPAGGRYVVQFSDIATANTMLAEHRITVSSKPLRDPALTLVEKAVVIATFTAHEIGHTYVTRPRKQPVHLINAHNPHSGFGTIANIADDVILEPFMVERFPILADAFEFTGGWVLRTTARSLPHRDTLNSETTPEERFNIIAHAIRYGDIPEIEWNDPRAAEERDWARDWARRLLALPLTDHAAFLAACDEVWERVRLVDDTPPPEPEPEPDESDEDDEDEDEDEDEEDGDNDDIPQPTDEVTDPGEQPDDDGGNETGEPGDEPDEDEDDGEGGEPTDEPGDQPSDQPRPGNDFGQDGDEDTDDGDGESDEDGDGDGEGSDDGSDGDGEDGDEPGGDTGSGDSESDDDGDGDGESGDGDGGDDDATDDGHDDYTGHDGDGDPGQDAAGGGGNAEAHGGTLRDEDDFDTDEVDETLHDSAEQTDYHDADMEAKVRTYDATTSTVFGHHGRLTTVWD